MEKYEIYSRIREKLNKIIILLESQRKRIVNYIKTMCQDMLQFL